MKNRIVRKSNALIEASYKLSAAEQRVIIFLVSMIHQDDEDFREYVLPIKEFAEMAGLKHKGEYGEIKEITRRLMGLVLEISTPTGLLQVGWLSSAEYQDGAGEVILNFDKKLKPYLLQLKDRFTKFGLEQVIRLKSSYSIRLYELLKQYARLRERTFLIDDFRAKMGIVKDQYKNFNTLKRNVILVAQEELAKQSDITFNFEEIKIGRGVGKIRFMIRSKVLERAQLAEAEEVPIMPQANKSQENTDLEKLNALLPTPFQGKETINRLLFSFLKKNGFEYVARNIVYTNEKSNAVNPAAGSGKPGNYRNYLTKTLRGDFGLAFLEDLEARKASSEKVRQEVEAAKAGTRQAQEKAQLEQENMERAREFRQNLPPEALEALKQEALAKMEPSERNLATGKSSGADFILKVAMDRICLVRMKLA